MFLLACQVLKKEIGLRLNNRGESGENFRISQRGNLSDGRCYLNDVKNRIEYTIRWG